MKYFLLAPIWLYRKLISPLLPHTCRFYPTCSAYAYEAIATHGALRGGFYALKRILKCHPLHPGGVDYIPQKGSQYSKSHAGG